LFCKTQKYFILFLKGADLNYLV